MHFEIIVGSVLGASEYVAEALADFLNENKHSCKLHFQPDLTEIDTEYNWLVVTSTHGAGDLPENIHNFSQQLQGMKLFNNFIIIGLGDSSYDTFCFGSIKLQEQLEEAGAKLLYNPLHIDVLHHPVPEEVALEWLKKQTLFR